MRNFWNSLPPTLPPNKASPKNSNMLRWKMEIGIFLYSKKNLNTIRAEMKEITQTYKSDLQKTKDTCDNKIASLKKEFHKMRSQYTDEKKNREVQLFAAYNKQIDPLKAQERDFVNLIEPAGSNNFAKNR